MSTSQFPQRHFVRLTVLAALAVASPAAFSAAGTVAFLQGDVSIRGAQGALRAAERGSAVESGETVETGSGRVQLRMTDGAYISLQPQTALRLDSYQTASGNTPESGVMSLLRGGLRTITGLIGKSQRQNYRLSTPTATVGIRGTEFLATADNGTRVRVAGGIVALCTEGGGCIDLTNGQTGFAPNSAARPTLVAQAPSLPPNPAPEQETVFASAEDRNESGASVVLGPSGNAVYQMPLPPGPGGLAPVFNSAYGGAIQGGLLGGSSTFNATGGLIEFVDSGGGPHFHTGTLADNGSDGIIAWGRWTAGEVSNSPISSMHYIATANTYPVQTPIVQAFASFASTAPTMVNNSTGAVVQTGLANSVTGTLNVNFFSTSGGSLSYALNVPIGGETYTMTGTAHQFFTTSFLGNADTNVTSTGPGCAFGCTGNNIIPNANGFQGTFTGTGANLRAGATYGFDAQGATVTVSGAIVFK